MQRSEIAMETPAARCRVFLLFTSARRQREANTNHRRVQQQHGEICLFVKSEKTPSDIASSLAWSRGEFCTSWCAAYLQLQRELVKITKCVKISLKTSEPSFLDGELNTCDPVLWVRPSHNGHWPTHVSSERERERERDSSQCRFSNYTHRSIAFCKTRGE